MKVAEKKSKVQLPIDNLNQLWPRDLKRSRIGAVLHPASISADLTHSLDVLRAYDGELFRLSALFGPQHGIRGETQDNMIEWEGYQHPELNIPVFSLYGEHRKPTATMLQNLDALVVDLQDVGARYYTFIWTLYHCMEACEAAGVAVVVCDRPNPITARIEEGPTLDPAYRSFVGLHPIRMRHGKTIGELAKQFQHEAFPNCQLTILPMAGYEPSMWYDETGLPWVLPSPNMPTLETAIVYPGMCLFEATNVSEARGTTRPFELFGAPWIRGNECSRQLNRLGLPGVFFREAYFQPTFHKYQGDLCQGAQFHITNREAFLPFRSAIEILKYLSTEYPENFAWKSPPYEYEYEKLPIEILLGGPLNETFPPP